MHLARDFYKPDCLYSDLDATTSKEKRKEERRSDGEIPFPFPCSEGVWVITSPYPFPDERG